MLRRRDWSQAMVFRVGKNTSNPYVQALAYAETPIIGHVCCYGAAFLLVVLPRRPSALVPRLWGSQSKFSVDRIKRLSPRSIVITIVWSLRIRTSARTPKGFHGSPQKSGSIANQLSELGFQVNIAIGETGIVGITQTVPNPRSSTARCGCQCGSRGDAGAAASVAKPTLKGDEP
jgi:hypothetical protein